MMNTKNKRLSGNVFLSRRGGAGVVALIVIGVLALLAFVVFMSFKGMNNTMVDRDEGVNGAWAQVEVVLQRRYDLIPNLVNTVKGFAEQEREVLTEVTRLRSQWANAKTVPQKVAATNAFESALGRLMVISEKYPDLKSNQNFLALQSQLEGTENRIAVERRRYNEAVRAYNSYIRKFPQNIIAGMVGFEVKDSYFEAAEGAQEAPEVSF